MRHGWRSVRRHLRALPGYLDPFDDRRRHRIQFQAGAFKKGLGTRISVNWRGGTKLRADGSNDLKVADLLIGNVDVFANLADVLAKPNNAWLKGGRVELSIQNLFDNLPKVEIVRGPVPVTYQSRYLDPLGRTLTLSLRKTF